MAQKVLGGGVSSLHSGVEFGRRRTSEGSSGGRKKEVVYRVGQERLGPSYFFIPLVLGPLNSLVWWEVPLGVCSFALIFVSARTNKRHDHHCVARVVILS